MEKYMDFAVPFFCTTNKEIKELHDKNNKFIKSLIDKFIKANDFLDPKDFVVIGSSCASYMDYLVLKGVRDLDIYVFDEEKRNKCTKIFRVDLIQRELLLPDFTERLIEKDGYYFLSKDDFLINVCSAFLKKDKAKNALYTKIMLLDLNKTWEELHEVLKANVSDFRECKEKPWVLEKMTENLENMSFYFSEYKVKHVKRDAENLIA